MPDFDLDDEAPDKTSECTRDSCLQRAIVTWSHNGQERRTILIAKASVDAGRNQSRDICLRFEPSNDPSNYEKTKQISLHHFSLRYLGSGVEFVDAGSTNGSTIDQRPVESNTGQLVESNVLVSIAGVLDLDLEPVFRREAPADGAGVVRAAIANAANPSWLQERLIGDDKPGIISCFAPSPEGIICPASSTYFCSIRAGSAPATRACFGCQHRGQYLVGAAHLTLEILWSTTRRGSLCGMVQSGLNALE